jgi:hypothetical protein
MNHTQGPWDYESFALSEEIVSNDKVIATVYSRHCTFPEEMRANARLIAAAPDLLEALQELYHLIDSAHDGERVFTTEMQKKAKAAIAKATGE